MAEKSYDIQERVYWVPSNAPLMRIVLGSLAYEVTRTEELKTNRETAERMALSLGGNTYGGWVSEGVVVRHKERR